MDKRELAELKATEYVENYGGYYEELEPSPYGVRIEGKMYRAPTVEELRGLVANYFYANSGIDEGKK